MKLEKRIAAAFNHAEKDRGHYIIYFREGYGYEMSLNCKDPNGVNIFFEGKPLEQDKLIWKNILFNELPAKIKRCLINRELESI